MHTCQLFHFCFPLLWSNSTIPTGIQIILLLVLFALAKIPRVATV